MRLEIHGEIDDDTVEYVGDKIYKEFVPGENIEIDINSQGGYIEAAEAIVDIIRECKASGSKVICTNSGDVMSSATPIWLTGDQRIWDTRHAFLIHNPYIINVSGDAESLLEDAIQLVAIEQDLASIYSMFSKNTADQILGIMKENRPLSLRELENLGFITDKVKVIHKYAKQN